MRFHCPSCSLHSHPFAFQYSISSLGGIGGRSVTLGASAPVRGAGGARTGEGRRSAHAGAGGARTGVGRRAAVGLSLGMSWLSLEAHVSPAVLLLTRARLALLCARP